MNTRHTIVPTGLELDSISPRQGAKYSPNLHAYLAAKRNRAQLEFARVYRDEEGTLWLGYIDDDYFVGARLMSVLCEGAKTERFAYPNLAARLSELEDFWVDYRRDGRCAIDPQHREHFVGERWTIVGDERSCLWCRNVTQRLRRWTESVERSAWEPVARP